MIAGEVFTNLLALDPADAFDPAPLDDQQVRERTLFVQARERVEQAEAEQTADRDRLIAMTAIVDDLTLSHAVARAALMMWARADSAGVYRGSGRGLAPMLGIGIGAASELAARVVRAGWAAPRADSGYQMHWTRSDPVARGPAARADQPRESRGPAARIARTSRAVPPPHPPRRGGNKTTRARAAGSNRYEGPCIHCGRTVPIGAGFLERVGTEWVVSHADPCPDPDPTPAPTPNGHPDDCPICAAGDLPGWVLIDADTWDRCPGPGPT